ncbi:related to PAF acetylhydrolase family protein [Fusarium torulosum]|uniref:1-alkyl-2-acetylglycerophosphocholine esterase n=1 Tax=Fusarium torulosum TaxID=33205 RepID=A0AAE8SHJ7_9HYPO|nr:related to PAF acetylhydrolase family protein [Fusarium torulosum]
MRLLLLLLPLFGLGDALLVPNSSGPYGVALRVQGMTDDHRIDPYDPKKGHRQVLASIFWPVDKDSCSKKIVPYMPPATAEHYGQQVQALGLSNDTFKAVELEVCTLNTSRGSKSGCKTDKKYPVAIFSPGAGNSRLLYSAMARSLASYGNVVVLIDHPYDQDIVEFPGGKIIKGGNIPEDTPSLEKLAGVRAKDISFVISQVKSLSFQRKVFKGLPGTVDTDKIVALGHSLGGASAANAVLWDSRIRGGMNMDGRLFEPALSKGLKKPFFLIGRPDHDDSDKTWEKFYNNLKGPKDMNLIKGAQHGSFTDYPQLISALGLPKETMKTLVPLIGSVDGPVLEKLIAKTVTGYMKRCFGRN